VQVLPENIRRSSSVAEVEAVGPLVRVTQREEGDQEPRYSYCLLPNCASAICPYHAVLGSDHHPPPRGAAADTRLHTLHRLLHPSACY
jgi:hypothetical protein